MRVRFIIKASFHPIWSLLPPSQFILKCEVEPAARYLESVLIGKSVKLKQCVSMSLCTEGAGIQVSAYNLIKYDVTTQKVAAW